MYLAAGEGHKEIVELLIAEGADVHAKDKWGFTPLHKAALCGHKEVAELLIAKGADVNAKHDLGGTPLHAAAQYGSINCEDKEVVELLIAKGADVNAKIEAGKLKGKTPLDRAYSYQSTAALFFIRKHGGKTGEELKAEGK